MDFTTGAGIVGALVAGASTVAWWAFRSIHARVGALEKELADHKLHVAETYAPNSTLEKAMDRFSAAIDAVYKKLERIDERLADKADRS